ncbi:hypothetical protein B566_EDAN000919 [Ephemera danica]|nr:hypothetical protein B566_EDAN000919 [Ephemera danica]
MLHYSKSIHIYPNVAAYNNRAMANLKLKNFQHCINDCNAVLTKDTDNMKALFRIALAYSKLGNSAEAIKYFSKALEIEPENKLLQNELAKLTGKDLERINVAEPTKEKKTRILIEELNTPASADKTENSASNEIIDVYCENSVQIPLPEMNKDDSLTASDKQIKEQQGINHNIETMQDLDKVVAIAKGISPFEFLNRWRNTKKDSLFEFASLLKSFHPETLPKMMGSELDGTILATFIRTLKSCFLNNDEDLRGASSLFNALAGVKRFHIVSSFLTQQEREDAVYVMKQLEENSFNVFKEIRDAF